MGPARTEGEQKRIAAREETVFSLYRFNQIFERIVLSLMHLHAKLPIMLVLYQWTVSGGVIGSALACVGAVLRSSPDMGRIASAKDSFKAMLAGSTSSIYEC